MTDEDLKRHFRGWSNEALVERYLLVLKHDLSKLELKMIDRELERRKEAEEVA